MSAVSVNRAVRKILRSRGEQFERWETTAIRGYRRYCAGFITKATDVGVVITHRDGSAALERCGAALPKLERVRDLLQSHGLTATLEATDSHLYPWRLFIPTAIKEEPSLADFTY